MIDISIIPYAPTITLNLFDGSMIGDKSFFVSAKDVDDFLPRTVTFSHSSEFILNPTPANNEMVAFEFLLPIPITTVGNYIYNVTVIAEGGNDVKNFNIYINAINEAPPPGPPPPPPPADLNYYPKYEFESGDFTATVLEQSYDGDVIPVNGRFVLNYTDKDDHFHPIVASSVKLYFDADSNMTFDDLYSEKERKFKAVIKKGNDVKFEGFINPDGIWEDYVYDRWVLSVSATDGLPNLKNISFSPNASNTYSGMMNLLDIIVICLSKTGLNLPLNTHVKIFYTGFIAQIDILNNVYLRVDAYKNGSEGMNCADVLESILRIFNATIVQMNGEWFIYRPIDLQYSTEFIRYVSGSFEGWNTINTQKTVGSHINGFTLHHANANQRKSKKASVQAYRIYYEYRGSVNILTNGSLKLNTGLTLDGWVVSTAPDGLVDRHASGYGIRTKTAGVPQNTNFLNLNQNIDILQDSVFTVRFDFEHTGLWAEYLTYSIGVGNQWFNLSTGTWSTTLVRNRVSNAKAINSGGSQWVGAGRASHEVSVRAPISGLLNIVVYRDVNGTPGDGIFTIHGISVTPDTSLNQKGREYTGRRKTFESTVTKTNETVINGDSESDLFAGTLFKSDKDNPAATWYREGKTESLQLLAINAEDNLRISPRPMTFFEGDVYGWIDFISLISIDLIAGKYQMVKYSYDSRSNVSDVNFLEFENAYLPETEFIVEIKDNYTNEVKAVIK